MRAPKSEPVEGEKAMFIRTYPDMAAKELVAKATAAGLSFGESYVRAVRNRDKRRGDSPSAPHQDGADSMDSMMTSGSAFVRAQAENMPTDEVVAKASEAGFKISKSLVYSVRSMARSKRGQAAKDVPTTPSEFIRAHPGVAPSELHRMAEEAGYSFSRSLIAYTRKVDAAKVGGATTVRKRTAAKAKRVAARAQNGNGSNEHHHDTNDADLPEEGVVSLLRALAGSLGTARAISILQQDSDRVAAVLSSVEA